jgi:hypothetical protein
MNEVKEYARRAAADPLGPPFTVLLAGLATVALLVVAHVVVLLVPGLAQG